MSIAKPPKQFRITFIEQQDYVYDEGGNMMSIQRPRLGFQVAYLPGKAAYEKQKKTQDKWAYGDEWHDRPDDPSFFERDSKMWISRGSWEKYDGAGHADRKFITVKTQVAEHLQPIIVDNVVLEGFRIQRMVGRYGTSNKLWRILDPRGFELEITSGNMEDLLMSGVVDKGLIIGPCIWRTGKILERV